MPELPDIEAYLEALRPRLVGQALERVRIGSPFLLRTVEPPLDSLGGKRVERLSRLGKRIVIEFEGELFLVLHLMIAGLGSSRVDLQACKLEYSIVSPK